MGIGSRISAALKAGGNAFMGKNMALGFDGASGSARMRTFAATDMAINALLQAEGPALRRRARHLVRNNPYAKEGKRKFVAQLVGTGITPTSQHPDPAIRKAINEAFARSADEMDADGRTNFYGLQAVAAGGMFQAGESFARHRARRTGDGLSVPYQVQMLASEIVPLWKNQPSAGAGRIVNGIELNAIGQRTAFWCHRSHPGEMDTNSAELVAVPATEMMHLFEVEDEGQMRGYTRIAAALVKLWLLDQFEDATLDRQKVASMVAGFLKSRDGADPSAAGDLGEDAGGFLNWGPGTLLDIGDKDVVFPNLPEVGSSYEPFVMRQLLAVAVGLGIPYASLTGDLRQVNYSSVRTAIVEWRRCLEMIQYNVLIPQFCKPVWSRWMDTAVLSGALDLPDYRSKRAEYQRVKWTPPKWEWVDPLKDRRAELMAVRAGFKTRSDVIAAEGYSPEQVDLEIAADNARADRLGLVLDSDPRRVTSSGVGQFVDPDPTDVGPGQPTPDDAKDAPR